MVILVLTLAGITTTLPVLVLFLAIKTYTDVEMHVRKHAGETGLFPGTMA